MPFTKPANILIAGDGTPKVTDFGIAKRLEFDSGLTVTGVIMGTPTYMAPEQARGEGKRVGPAADVYAIGVVMYRCLTGRTPFEAESAVELLKKVADEEPIVPQKLDPTIQADLQTICLKCMEKDPSKRYASADAVANDLRRWIDNEPIHARPTRPTERLIKWVRRQPVAAALFAVSILSACLILGGSLYFSIQLGIKRDTALRQQRLAETAAIDAESERKIAFEKEREAREAQSNAEKISGMLIGMLSADEG